MQMHSPLARALTQLGATEFAGAFTYQDYLYELCADGFDSGRPISEAQWDAIVDMQGIRRLTYSSTVATVLKNRERRANGT